MTIKEFLQIIHPDTKIKVFDDWGLVGRFNRDELQEKFCMYNHITEIKPFDYNLIGIKLAKWN